MNLERKQIEPWRRGPLPFLFFFFFHSHRKLLRWVKSFSSSIREHLTCNTFCFCLIFFLLDNTLKGGDRVRGGFSSQNIPTPLKTIRLTITFILPFSNDYGNFVCKVTLASFTDSFNSPWGNSLFVCTYFQHRWQQLALHLLHIRGLLNYYDVKTCLEVQGSCEGFILPTLFYYFSFKKVKALFTNTVIKPDHL